MAVSEEKITVYNLADLKNTSDDAIPNYLNSLKFTQSHRLTDIRLGLGYAALALAGACFMWDWKLGFDATKWYTAATVALYSLLNGALTLWIFWVERGVVYVGTAPSGEKLRIATHTRKNVPEYRLTVEVQGGKNGKGKKQTLEIVRSFTGWFDEVGHFVAPPFQSMLATAIPLVGKHDPKRVASAGGKEEDVVAAPSPYTPEMLDALANAAETLSGADAGSGKKGGKRRKA